MGKVTSVSGQSKEGFWQGNSEQPWNRYTLIREVPKLRDLPAQCTTVFGIYYNTSMSETGKDKSWVTSLDRLYFLGLPRLFRIAQRNYKTTPSFVQLYVPATSSQHRQPNSHFFLLLFHMHKLCHRQTTHNHKRCPCDALILSRQTLIWGHFSTDFTLIFRTLALHLQILLLCMQNSA